MEQIDKKDAVLSERIKKISPFQILLIIELALVLFCALQYAFPRHQYVYRGKDLTGSFCTYQTYSEEYDEGCYLDKTLVSDDTVDLTSLYITTPYVDLPKGSYDVTFIYETNDPNQKYSANAKYATYPVLTDNQGRRLPMDENRFTYSFFSPNRVDEYQVHVDYSGEGHIFVESITIQETNAWKNILLLGVIVFSLLVDGILIGYRRILPEKQRETRMLWMALACLVICSGIPLFEYYLREGDDLLFHLNRIEGIRVSLQAGQFPNRVSSYWNKGYGYVNGVFYGELFLYLPALLRLLGFSVQGAYKIYVFLINLATALVSFHCFDKIVKDKKAAFIGSAAYLLAPYRLVCIYNRGAVGEYTSMLFIPLIFYGLYQIYRMEPDEKDEGRGWIPLFLGYTGLIQTHVISCVTTSVFVGLFCLVSLKRIFCGRRFLQLLKAAAMTTLVNLWFLLPFADYFLQGYANTATEAVTLGRMGAHGAFLSQMLSVFQDGSAPAYTVMEALGPVRERNYTLGGSLFVLLFYVCLRLYRGRERTEISRLGDNSLLFALLAAFMSTIWFPWDGIQQMNGLFRMITRNIQFPWRFLGACCFFSAVTAVCLAVALRSELPRQLYFGVLFFLGFVFWLSADYYMYHYMQENMAHRYVTESNLDSCAVGQGEYLLRDTPEDFVQNRESVPGEGLQIAYEKRDGGTHIVACRNETAQESYVDVPFLPYRGYCCRDNATGAEFEVQLTVPGRVRVIVPAGYDGTLNVRFEEPWYWRVSEGVSLLTLAAWLFGRMRKRRETAAGGRKGNDI